MNAKPIVGGSGGLNWPLMQNNIIRQDLDAVIDLSARG